MVHELDWMARVAADIGQRVADYRREFGLTAQQLADRCGVPSITRVVIARLENGRRGSVSTAELQVLANALGVPPVLLLFPLGRAGTVEVLPGRDVDPWAAIEWFTGNSDDPGDLAAPPQLGARSPIVLWAEYLRCAALIPVQQKWLDDFEAQGDPALKIAADSQAQSLAVNISALRRIREVMQETGLTPPPLHPETARILEAHRGAR